MLSFLFSSPPLLKMLNAYFAIDAYADAMPGLAPMPLRYDASLLRLWLYADISALSCRRHAYLRFSSRLLIYAIVSLTLFSLRRCFTAELFTPRFRRLSLSDIMPHFEPPCRFYIYAIDALFQRYYAMIIMTYCFLLFIAYFLISLRRH